MLLHILNILGELFGFYKKGAVDKPDKRDYDAVERLGSYEDKLPKEVDLLNTSPDNQGYTNKCFHGSVGVLMPNFSYREIRDISVGDYVMTHKGRFRRVTKKFQNIWQGTSYKIRTIGTFYAPECTPNHPFLTQDGWKEAKDITTDDYLCFHSFSEIEKDTSVFPFESDPDFLWCLGLFLADGSFNEYSTKFSLNTTTKLGHAKRLKATMEKLGADVSWNEYGEQNLTITVRGRFWRNVFRDLCGEHCDKKKINDRLMVLNTELQMNIFEGWNSGDGQSSYEDVGRIMVSTTSECLLRQMQQILLRNEKTATIRKRKKREERKQSYELYYYFQDKKDTTKNKRNKFSYWKDGNLFVRVRDIEKTKQYTSGNVYNLEVEEDESYIAEGFVVHNCTAYATSHAMRIMNIMEHKNKAIWFDPDLQWENQKEYPGTAEDALGDYVQSALKSAVRFGFEAGGRVYTADKYARCMKPKVKDMLAKGYPVVTGAYTANPMCDLDWNYIKPKSKGGGHAFVLVGYSDVEKCYYAFNSWGRWGIKGTGVFKIRYEDFSSIFSCYVLYDSKDDLKEN